MIHEAVLLQALGLHPLLPAPHLQQLRLARLLKLKTLGLAWFLGTQPMWVGMRLPQALEEIEWSVALILLGRLHLVLQVRIDDAARGISSTVPAAPVLESWQHAGITDLLEEDVLISQVVAGDAPLVSDLSLFEYLQKEFKSYSLR